MPPPADIVRWGVQKLQRLVLGMDTHSFLPLSLEHCSAEYPPFTFVQSGEAFMATGNTRPVEPVKTSCPSALAQSIT